MITKMRPYLPVLVGAAMIVLISLGVALLGYSDLSESRFSGNLSLNFPQARQGSAPHVTQVPESMASGHAVDISPVLVVALVLVFGIIVTAVGVLLTRAIRNRRVAPEMTISSEADKQPPNIAAPDESVVAPRAVERGIQRALHELETVDVPANAIIRAWLGLEQSAHDSGITKRDAETPTEFASRVLSAFSTDEGAITTLRDRYLSARFSQHPSTDSDLLDVRHALRSLAAHGMTV